VSVGDEMVLLTATCRNCGRVAEVGYIQGRARVIVTGYRCGNCGADDVLKPPLARPIAQERMPPRPSRRRRQPSEHVTRG